MKRHAALPFIVVTVLLNMIGIGLIIPVLPKLAFASTREKATAESQTMV